VGPSQPEGSVTWVDRPDRVWPFEEEHAYTYLSVWCHLLTLKKWMRLNVISITFGSVQRGPNYTGPHFMCVMLCRTCDERSPSLRRTCDVMNSRQPWRECCHLCRLCLTRVSASWQLSAQNIAVNLNCKILRSAKVQLATRWLNPSLRLWYIFITYHPVLFRLQSRGVLVVTIVWFWNLIGIFCLFGVLYGIFLS